MEEVCRHGGGESFLTFIHFIPCVNLSKDLIKNCVATIFFIIWFEKCV